MHLKVDIGNLVKSFFWDPWPTTCQHIFSLVLGFWDILKEIWPPDPSWFCGRNLWQIFAVCEYHSWRTVLKFGMNTPLEHMNMHAKNHFSSFFSLVRIHSFLYIFKNFKCQLRPNEKSWEHEILQAYHYGCYLLFW